MKQYHHGITHTRPIHASGRHIGDAANDAPQDSLAATEALVALWNEQDMEREEARRDTRRWMGLRSLDDEGDAS